MITPAVLISASGIMILSSSTLLGRVVDRTRSLSDRLQEVSSGDAHTEFFEERRALGYDHLCYVSLPFLCFARRLTRFCFAVGRCFDPPARSRALEFSRLP